MRKYHMHNRPNRELTEVSDISSILKSGKFAVISMNRDNEPYIVSLSYGYHEDNNALYFHCAKEGLKIEFINANSTVCATVIEDGGYIKGECAHEYKSVVFWGTMNFVTDIDEKKKGMKILLNHLENDKEVIETKLNASDSYYSNVEILRLDIKEIKGKAGR